METASAASVGLGIAFNLGFSYVFFYIIYPFVIWKLGFLKGGIAMTSLSLTLNYIFIAVYDRFGRDWFGIEALKEKIKRMEGRSAIGKFMAGAIKRSGPLALVILSIKFDPFVTTVYLRDGCRRFMGLDFRDWTIFFSSAAIGNGYWIFVIFGGGTLLRFVHGFFK